MRIFRLLAFCLALGTTLSTVSMMSIGSSVSAQVVTPVANRPATPALMPGTRASAFSTIQGSAIDGANRAVSNSVVRVRDARMGRIVNTQVTDQTGLFTFKSLDPGNYIVELMSKDQSVIATSDLLTVNGGDSVTALLKTAYKLPPLGGVLGHTATSVALVAASATATGILAVQVTGCVSPPCTDTR